MLYALIGLLNAISSSVLGLFVYIKDPKRSINKTFGIFCFFLSFWSYSYFFWQISTTGETALFWSRLLMAWAIFIPISYLHFVFAFTQLVKKSTAKIILFSGYLISFLFFISNFTPLFVTDVKPRLGFRFWPSAGILYTPFLIIWFFLAFYSIALLFRTYRNSIGIKKSQLIYVLSGTIIGYLGGATNYFLWYDVPIPPIGNWTITLYTFLVAYAIVTKKLFDIKVLLTSFFVGLIAILIGIDALIFTERLTFQVIKGGILIAFIFFGYLLVRSVLREIRYREEIARAYEMEKKARAQVEELTEAKTQFILATQHHLRTPLTSMIGYLDLIFGGTYGKVPQKLKTTLLKFQVSTKRLIRVVNTLLDISQFQMGKKVVFLQPGINFESLLKEVMEELRFEIKVRGLYLKYEKIGEIPAIKADPEKLKVALFNIADNGIKYTRQGGLIMKLQTIGSNVQLSIKDTGIGIEPEQARKLFETTFERGEEAKKVHGFGRGIGLFVTSHIIRAHNGKIWAESEGEGKGSAFYVELPVG